jgi:drug/metabolite transporter (DMT)-like permease
MVPDVDRWVAGMNPRKKVRQPAWLLGGLFLIGTFVFQALGLYFGPLSLVQPVLVLELIFTLGLRVFLLHDDIAARTWSAALTICLGLAASSR